MRSNDLVHISTVRDGSIVTFPSSAYYWMKVCSPITGIGAVVNLGKGTYYLTNELEVRGLGVYCRQIFNDLDECYYGESVE